MRTLSINQRTIAPFLFLAPGVLFFLFYVIFPIFQSIGISFYEWDGLGERTYVGVENYVELMDDEAFYTSLKNNVIWLVLYMLAIPAGLFIALFLNQTVWGIRLYKSLFFFPFVISQVVVGLVFSWFLRSKLRLDECRIEESRVFADSSAGRRTLRDIRHHRRWAVASDRLLHDSLPDRPERCRSRADRSGKTRQCPRMRMLWYIILPQLKPATFIAIVVTVIGALRSFDLISIMTDGGPWGSSRVLAFYMYEQAFSEYGFRMGYGAAIAVVLFLIMLIYIAGFLYKMYRDERDL